MDAVHPGELLLIAENALAVSKGSVSEYMHPRYRGLKIFSILGVENNWDQGTSSNAIAFIFVGESDRLAIHNFFLWVYCAI